MKNENKSDTKNIKKEENWIDDVMKQQEQDLKIEEDILSTVPNRMRQKYIDLENE